MTGKLTKKQLKKAFLDQESEGFGIFGNQNQQSRLRGPSGQPGQVVVAPQTSPVVQTVMTFLEENTNGLLKKQDVAAAIQKVADFNDIVIDQAAKEALV